MNSFLITEPKDYSTKALAIYKKLGRVYLWDDLLAKDKNSILSTINVVIIGLTLPFDKNLIELMPNLEIVVSPTTGLNHIDIDYVRHKKIKIISLRNRMGFLKNVPSTAEEAFALILALLRKIPWAFDDVKNGKWNRLDWRGYQLLGKTIGIVGFGRLGRIVASYAKVFGVKIIACDPNVSAEFMKSRGAAKVSMDELFKKSDIVSLHVLLTDETHNLIKEKHLRSMKPSAYFINTARAELVEKGALEKALKQKWIAGAAVDVMWDEKGDGNHLKNNLLVEYAKKNKNLIILPHIGGATYEAMQVTQDYIAELVFKNLKK